MAVRPGTGRPMAPGAARRSAPPAGRMAPRPTIGSGMRPMTTGVVKKDKKKKQTGFQQVLSSLRTSSGTQSRMNRFG